MNTQRSLSQPYGEIEDHGSADADQAMEYAYDRSIDSWFHLCVITMDELMMRLQSGDELTDIQSLRFARFRRLVNQAEQSFGGLDGAIRWLSRSRRELFGTNAFEYSVRNDRQLDFALALMDKSAAR